MIEQEDLGDLEMIAKRVAIGHGCECCQNRADQSEGKGEIEDMVNA